MCHIGLLGFDLLDLSQVYAGGGGCWKEISGVEMMPV